MLRPMLRLILALLMLLAVLPARAADYRLGLITPPSHQWTKTAQEIAAEIKTATDGRVNILVFPSGQLGNEARMLQQLQTGAIDFAMMTAGEFANRNPDYGVFQAPYLVHNADEARRLLRGPVAHQLLDGMNRFGLKGLAWGMAGMRQIVTAERVTSADQLQGKKIRTVPMAPSMDFWKAAGAAPTPMPLPDLYDAFANGQIDGMQIDYEGTWNSGYWRHAGSIIASNHMMFPMAAVASGRKWQRISPADRKVISDIFAQRVDQMVGKYAAIDAGYLAELRKTGVPVIEAGRDWFGPAVDRWYEEWRAKTPVLAALESEVHHGPDMANKTGMKADIQFTVPGPKPGADYRIGILIPDGAVPEGGYASVWLLDGQAALQDLGEGFMDGPNATGHAPVVVTLGYDTDKRFALDERVRDYTPPKETAGDGRDRPSGGADAFHKILVEQIIPQVEDRVTLSQDHRTIWGHSFGGLFVLREALRPGPKAFTDYAAASPSLWYDDMSALHRMQAEVAAGKVTAARVDFYIGGSERERAAKMHPRLNDGRASPMLKMRAALPEDALPKLVHQFRDAGIPGRFAVFPGLSHGETFTQSLQEVVLGAAGLDSGKWKDGFSGVEIR